MSDSCRLVFRSNTDHEAIRWVLAGAVSKAVSKGLFEYAIDEANHACCEELDKLAANGVLFVGFHGSGSGYGGRVFASDGIEIRYHDVSPTGVLTIQLSETGTPSAEDIIKAQEFVLFRASVRATMTDGAKTMEPDPTCKACGAIQ